MLEPTHGIPEVKVGGLLREAGYHSDVALERNLQDLIHLKREKEEVEEREDLNTRGWYGDCKGKRTFR